VAAPGGDGRDVHRVVPPPRVTSRPLGVVCSPSRGPAAPGPGSARPDDDCARVRTYSRRRPVQFRVGGAGRPDEPDGGSGRLASGGPLALIRGRRVHAGRLSG
jgi:hypothetical protein